jgi:hypothetical protein
MCYLLRLCCIFCLAIYINSCFASAINPSQQVLVDIKKNLISRVDYTPQELDKMTEEFKDYYINNISPNLERLISKTQVIFVDMNPALKNQEVVLLGDTVRSSAWGPKNFIAVAIKEEDNGWKIVAFKEIEGSIECDGTNCHFQYFTMTKYPKTPNKFVGLIIGYALYGASGHEFYNQIVSWNRYSQKYDINMISSKVPLIPDPN